MSTEPLKLYEGPRAGQVYRQTIGQEFGGGYALWRLTRRMKDQREESQRWWADDVESGAQNVVVCPLAMTLVYQPPEPWRGETPGWELRAAFDRADQAIAGQWANVSILRAQLTAVLGPLGYVPKEQP